MARAATLGRPRDDLQRLTQVVAVVVGVFGALVIGIMVYAGVVANRSALDRDQALLDNAFDQSISRVLNEQKSVSWWDDSVANTSVKFDKEWIDWNIGTFLTETYGHDEVYILSDSDQLIYSMEGAAAADIDADARVRQLAPVIREIRGQPSGLRVRNDLFAAAQNTYDQLSKVLDFAKWSGHILDLGGKPALVSVITIAPNTDMSLATGTPYLLISVVYIDDDFIADLSRSLLIPDLKLSKSDAGTDGTFSKAFITDDGSQAGEISWTPRQPGRILLTIILPLVVAGLVVFVFFTASTLRRLRHASTELADREANARHRSRHDALSGLPNRFFFTEVAARTIDGQLNTRGIVTLAYLDIDRFKDINDTLGHHAGDELIKAVATRLMSFIGESDFLARLAAMSWRCSGSLRRTMPRSYRRSCSQHSPRPLVSLVSTSRFRPPSDWSSHQSTASDVDELMRKADIALYQAKAEGRDRAVAFTEEMGQQVEVRRAIELDLREAIEKDQLNLFYQPIVAADGHDIAGVEALLRWQHPSRGNIPPTTFIPIAEESGLMPALGAWVLDRAFLDHAQWPQFEMSINLSPDQFRHVDLEHLLKDLVKKHEVDTHKIVLEITESLLLESSPRVQATLEAIKEMGFKIALDDFGTGYSSLTYLRTFTFDKLKIDRSFVTGLPEAHNSRTIVRAIVNLGRTLGMEVIAEGVESEAEAVMMRLFGCTALQGYFFSRPVDKATCNGLLLAQLERKAEAAKAVRSA